MIILVSVADGVVVAPVTGGGPRSRCVFRPADGAAPVPRMYCDKPSMVASSFSC